MTEPIQNLPPEEIIPEEKSFAGRKKLFIIGLTVIIIIGLGIGVYLYFFGEENTGLVNTSNINSSANTEIGLAPFYNQTIILTEESDDYDRDGLSNNKETSLGTDPKNSDTDSDGLGDYEEVNIYKTDPKVSDTDNDGYSDGEEVEKGYNPNGSGDLLNTSNAINENE